MRVVVLGCGGSRGVPEVGGTDGEGVWGACDPGEPRNRRGRSSIVVEGADGRRLLVDTGPDLRAQLLGNRIGRVEAILFTHAHADHVMGLDEVRQLNRSKGGALQAFGTEHTLAQLRARFEYAFLPPTPPQFFRPALVPIAVRPGDVVRAAGMVGRVFDQDHGVMQSLGVRIGGFAYSTDVVELPEASFAVLEGVDTWVVSCFQHGPHKVHAHLARVLEWVVRLRPRRTVLTHMGPDMDYGGLTRTLPGGVEAGFDGMVLEVAEGGG